MPTTSSTAPTTAAASWRSPRSRYVAPVATKEQHRLAEDVDRGPHEAAWLRRRQLVEAVARQPRLRFDSGQTRVGRRSRSDDRLPRLGHPRLQSLRQPARRSGRVPAAFGVRRRTRVFDLTASTGTVAWRIARSVVDPRSSSLTPPRPLDPIAIRSDRNRVAVRRISRAGLPTRTTYRVVGARPGT